MKVTRFLLMAMACLALTMTACGGDDEIEVNNGGGNGQEEPTPTPDPDPDPTPDPDPDPDPDPTPDPGTTPVIDPNGPAEYEGYYSWLSDNYIYDHAEYCLVEYYGEGAWLDENEEPIPADNYMFYFVDTTNGYQLQFEIQTEINAGFCGEFVSDYSLMPGSIVDATSDLYGCWLFQFDVETGEALLPMAPLFDGEATITAMEEEGYYSFEIEIGDLADEPDTHYLTCFYEGPVYDAAELASAKKGAKKVLNAKIERVRK